MQRIKRIIILTAITAITAIPVIAAPGTAQARNDQLCEGLAAIVNGLGTSLGDTWAGPIVQPARESIARNIYMKMC
jgi:hypothetical protein